MSFTHLHVHSHYSLLDGLTKIDELISAAKRNGMTSLAITDHGVLYGAIEFYKKARAAGINPIIGVEAYIAPFGMASKTRNEDKVRRHLILLAKDLEGYHNLLLLTTKAHLEGYYYKPRIDRELLRTHSKGLIALSGCLNGELSKLITVGNFEEAQTIAREYADIFGNNNFYLELQRHPGLPQQENVNKGLLEISRKTGIPVVATADLHYLNPEDKKAQEVLVAINTNKELTDDTRLSMGRCDLSFLSGEAVQELFGDIPEAIENTARIAERCNLQLELGSLKLPRFPLPPKANSNEYLTKLCAERLGTRYPATDGQKEARERLDYELDVIGKTSFADYFLIVWDIVSWAKSQGIVVGPGRGSAAGSLVSYLLGITDVDPLRYQLLFERFLNPERISPPDIDLDFADTRRDEVIAYARKRYGEDHVAQIITFGTLASRAGIRDVGRSLGYAYSYCDRLAKMIPFGLSLDLALEEVQEFRKLYDTDLKAKELIDLSRRLEGVARHASTHACGVVIAPEPLTTYTPLQNAAQGEKTIVVTQYEMHAVEDLGLLKMDFLGLKNLTIIEHTLGLLKKRGSSLASLEGIPLDDAATFALLREAKTKGIFQLESEGMQRYLKELEPSEFNDIMVMIALYRPGPMELIPTYIARKKGQEPVTYLHPLMEPALKGTYGIMIFQEQLMQVARDVAGFTLGQADILRKAVGKKIKELLKEQKNKLVEGMKEKGISNVIAQKVWKLIEPFDRYGFNRSHACGYAMVSYRTAFLKANHPLEFMTALLNTRQGDLDRIAFFVEEAKAMGLRVLPPDINESFEDFTPVGEQTIRFGLKAIKNVGEAIIHLLIEERQAHGPFSDVLDLITRVRERNFNKKVLESLIKSGALDGFNDRATLFANIDTLLRIGQEVKQENNSSQGSLFGKTAKPTVRLQETPPLSLQEKLLWERELLGLYLSGNPLEKHRALFEKKLIPLEKVNDQFLDRKVFIGGTIEEIKKIVTKKGDPMMFLRLKDFTHSMEVTVFPSMLRDNDTPWREGNIAIIEGKVERRAGTLQVICQRLKILQ